MEQLEEIKKAYYAASLINDPVAVARCGERFGALGTPEGDAWQVLATTYVSILKGDFIDAREQLLSSLDGIKALQDDRALLRCYMSLGIASTSLGLPDAIEMFERTIEMCERLGNRAGVAGAVSNIGIVHYHAFNNTGALECFSRALDVYSELNERNGMANSLCNVGNTFSAVGDYATALKYHLQALALHELTGNLNNKAVVCDNIGRDYSGMGDLDNAIIYGKRSTDLYTQIGNKSGVGEATSMLASANSRAGKFDSSIPLHREAIEIFRSTGQRHMVVMTSTNLASDLVEAGAIEEARSILQELAQTHDSNSDQNVVQNRTWSSIHLADNNIAAATESLTRALDIATANNFRVQLPGIYLQFRELCKASGDFEGYVRYNELHQKAENEIRGAEQLRKFEMQVAEQQMTQERHEREREREVLHNTLPKAVADRVIRGEVVNDHYDNAAVLFLDIVSFTSNTSHMPPADVVNMLENIFSTIDTICDTHDVVKVKTIGDSYMCFAHDGNGESGMGNTAAQRIATVALSLQQADFYWPREGSPEGSLDRLTFRIGIHSGPVTAGVIGTQRLQYDVWGDTVNVASRLESTSEPGRIHVSEAFAFALNTSPPSPLSSLRGGTDRAPLELERGGECSERGEVSAEGTWHLALRGETELKGKGTMTTYWLEKV